MSAYYKSLKEGQVVRFTAERGGEDKEYEVILRKPTIHTPWHWVAEYKGGHVCVNFNRDETFVDKMTSFRGTSLTTVCQHGVIHA